MVRKLKHHEQKLLKKVDFLQWKSTNNLRESEVLRRYHIQNREEYNKLVGNILEVANKISLLKDTDPFRYEKEKALLEKCYNMALITSKTSFSILQKITVSAFCRLKMAETVKEAVRFIEQGHVRVGPDTINDPAFFVTRSMEDFVTWVNTSTIKRKIMKYNDKLDDFDLL